jgi:hypothetical protein
MKTTAVRQDKRRVTPQDLQKMWQGVDLSRFWADVVKSVSKEADAYEHARAKSREGAAHQVLI